MGVPPVISEEQSTHPRDAPLNLAAAYGLFPVVEHLWKLAPVRADVENATYAFITAARNCQVCCKFCVIRDPRQLWFLSLVFPFAHLHKIVPASASHTQAEMLTLLLKSPSPLMAHSKLPGYRNLEARPCSFSDGTVLRQNSALALACKASLPDSKRAAAVQVGGPIQEIWMLSRYVLRPRVLVRL